MTTRIELCKWNLDGAEALICNDADQFSDRCSIALRKQDQSPKTICKLAAKRLRRLAAAFDRLAEMEKPFTEEAQRKAMKTEVPE